MSPAKQYRSVSQSNLLSLTVRNRSCIQLWVLADMIVAVSASVSASASVSVSVLSASVSLSVSVSL